MSVLQVENLDVTVTGGDQKIVEGMSFNVGAGEIVAIVGESGSGKSSACLAMIGLLSKGLEVSNGSVRIDDVELIGMGPREWRSVRGTGVGIIFQDSLAALNPVRTIGFQLSEARRLPGLENRKRAREWAIERLSALGFDEPKSVMSAYPHQLSGGMRQRVCAAIAFAGSPRVVLADEPTTALDVSLQGRMLRLLLDETRLNGSGLVLVSHDIAVVRAVADSIVVLYGGRVLEQGPASAVLKDPKSPYTRALMESVSTLDPATRGERLATIPGEFTPHSHGCPFRDRCGNAIAQCATDFPEPETDEVGRTFWCWNPKV